MTTPMTKPNPPITLEKHGTRAADTVISTLEERIVSGILRDGQMLPAERELMEEFGTSRTVVREAVKMLSSKGLVQALPRHRPIVRTPNYDTILGVVDGLIKHLTGQPGGVKQIFDIRIFVEAGLVRMAALEATKTDIANLRKALEKNGAHIGDSDAFYDSDMDFHAVLYTIPRNPIFSTIHRSFSDWLDWHWRQMPRLPERNARNYESHKAIFEAILNRDPDEAENVLRRHLDDAWKQVQNTFGEI